MFRIIIGSILLIVAWSNAAANFISHSSIEILDLDIVGGFTPVNGFAINTNSTTRWSTNDLAVTDGSSSYCGPAGCGPFPEGENQFDNLADGTTNWSRGDTDYSLGTFTDIGLIDSSFSAVAESQSAPDVTVENADANSRIDFDFQFVSDGSDITISVLADAYLEAWVNSDDRDGSQTLATTTFTIQISEVDTISVLLDSLVTDSFELSIENANSSCLNERILAYPGDGELTCGLGQVSEELVLSGLNSGTVYNFSLDVVASVSGIQYPATVSEPYTLALLSLGLAGLGFTRRWMKT